ncbi:hypothetical protein G6M50_09190 [Agrobacterium rhizogenes]|nr:hypothetical protein [Rhizobium rhizogenes]NTJ77973.1 hypothetical protein [Rhizobium rhizogenes]
MALEAIGAVTPIMRDRRNHAKSPHRRRSIAILPSRHDRVLNFLRLASEAYQQDHKHGGGKPDDKCQTLPPSLQNDLALADIIGGKCPRLVLVWITLISSAHRNHPSAAKPADHVCLQIMAYDR